MAETRAQPPGHPPIGYIHRGRVRQAEKNMASGLASDLLLFFWHDSRLTKIWLKLRSKVIPVILKRRIVNMLTYSDSFFFSPSYLELKAWAEFSGDPGTSGSEESWRRSTLEKGPSWQYRSTVILPYGTFPAMPKEGRTKNIAAACSAWGFPPSFELGVVWISSQIMRYFS